MLRMKFRKMRLAGDWTMRSYTIGDQHVASGRSYFGSETLTPFQKQAILSLPEDGGYGTLLNEGSVRASLVLMGFFAGGFSARWGMERARLTASGQKLRRKLAGKCL